MAHKCHEPMLMRSELCNIPLNPAANEAIKKKQPVSMRPKLAIARANAAQQVLSDSDDTSKIAIQTIQKLIKIRSMRGRYFSADLFADAAWDILLDLTASMAADRRVSVSSLCIAANVPTTTALRKIKAMIDDGLLIMVSDARDGRRKHVRLSESAYASMLEFALAVS